MVSVGKLIILYLCNMNCLSGNVGEMVQRAMGLLSACVTAVYRPVQQAISGCVLGGF